MELWIITNYSLLEFEFIKKYTYLISGKYAKEVFNVLAYTIFPMIDKFIAPSL